MGCMLFESCLGNIFFIYLLGKANEIKNKQICTVKENFQENEEVSYCVCVSD